MQKISEYFNTRSKIYPCLSNRSALDHRHDELTSKGHNRYILNFDTQGMQSILLNSQCCVTDLSHFPIENTPWFCYENNKG